jgi:hypothetical protein
MAFADTLANLPATEGVARLELLGPHGQVEYIENKPGSAGSVRVYAYLLAKYGAIDTDAAEEGLQIYAEHSEDARQNPGKHPNIDRLFHVRLTNGCWQVRVIQQPSQA